MRLSDARLPAAIALEAEVVDLQTIDQLGLRDESIENQSRKMYFADSRTSIVVFSSLDAGLHAVIKDDT